MPSEAMTPLQVLRQYFNTGEQKKPIGEFSAELKQLTPEEKVELAIDAAQELGVEVKVK